MELKEILETDDRLFPRVWRIVSRLDKELVQCEASAVDLLSSSSEHDTSIDREAVGEGESMVHVSRGSDAVESIT